MSFWLRMWSLQDELERRYEHEAADERPLVPPSAVPIFAPSENTRPVPHHRTPGGSGEARTDDTPLAQPLTSPPSWPASGSARTQPRS